jgi:2-aminobenzoate-CoA ligase
MGPADVEGRLAPHPAVAGCGVIDAPDSDRGQLVIAFVRLRQGVAGDAALESALPDHVRARLWEG